MRTRLMVLARGAPKDVPVKGVAAIPGAMTPTKNKRAYALGADVVKLFSADDLGYHYIQNLKGSLLR